MNLSGSQVQRKTIDLIFSRFAAFYGHVWRSQFKDERFLEFAKGEWHEGLSQFTDEILYQSIVSCRKFCEMPPTLPQLINFCVEIKKRMIFESEIVMNKKSILPRADYEVARVHLQRCKEILTKS